MHSRSTCPADSDAVLLFLVLRRSEDPCPRAAEDRQGPQGPRGNWAGVTRGWTKGQKELGATSLPSLCGVREWCGLMAWRLEVWAQGWQGGWGAPGVADCHLITMCLWLLCAHVERDCMLALRLLLLERLLFRAVLGSRQIRVEGTGIAHVLPPQRSLPGCPHPPQSGIFVTTDEPG